MMLRDVPRSLSTEEIAAAVAWIATTHPEWSAPIGDRRMFAESVYESLVASLLSPHDGRSHNPSAFRIPTTAIAALVAGEPAHRISNRIVATFVRSADVEIVLSALVAIDVLVVLKSGNPRGRYPKERAPWLALYKCRQQTISGTVAHLISRLADERAR